MATATTATATILIFNWADYAILGIVGISMVISLMRGFVREAISLITWIVAIWVAYKFNGVIAGFLTHYIKTPSIRLVVAFVLLFIIVLIIGALINFLISQLITSTGLGGTDRVLGILFGILRGILLVGVLILLAEMTTLPKDPWWEKSVFIPHFKSLTTWMHGYLPEKLGEIHNL